MQLSRDKLQLCGIQGRLFELSARWGADSDAFVNAFMVSESAARLDLPYDRLQWAGEEYLYEELVDEFGGFAPAGIVWSTESLYWMGYVYRLWHYLTGERSAEIVRISSPATMNLCWPGYHTLDPEAAIERLREAAALARQE